MRKNKAIEQAREILVAYCCLLQKSDLSEHEFHRMGDLRSKIINHMTTGIMKQAEEVEAMEADKYVSRVTCNRCSQSIESAKIFEHINECENSNAN